MNAAVKHTLVYFGERIARTLSYSRDDIAQFARLSGDANPLHVDASSAQRARFGEIIASGQQTAALLMGMLATHYSRSDDGLRRQMLCLNMNFAFKGPVFAEQPIELAWRVSAVSPNAKLKGVIALLDGSATPAHGAVAVVARGTILVSPAD